MDHPQCAVFFLEEDSSIPAHGIIRSAPCFFWKRTPPYRRMGNR